MNPPSLFLFLALTDGGRTYYVRTFVLLKYRQALRERIPPLPSSTDVGLFVMSTLLFIYLFPLPLFRTLSAKKAKSSHVFSPSPFSTVNNA